MRFSRNPDRTGVPCGGLLWLQPLLSLLYQRGAMVAEEEVILSGSACEGES